MKSAITKLYLYFIFLLILDLDLDYTLAEDVYTLEFRGSRLVRSRLILDDQTPYLTVQIVKEKHPLEPTKTEIIEDRFISVSYLSAPFLIKAPPTFGIMSVVETMNLRQNPDECKDFVRFEQNRGSYISPRICGDKDENNDVSDAQRGPRTFLDPGGQTRVYVQVSNDTDSMNMPNVIAKILFTSYRECPRDLVGSTLARCSASNNFSCIDRALFCDSRQHCGFDEEFGIDEYHCGIESTIRYSFVGVLLCLTVIYLLFIGAKKLKGKICDKRVKVAATSSLDTNIPPKSIFDDSAINY